MIYEYTLTYIMLFLAIWAWGAIGLLGTKKDKIDARRVPIYFVAFLIVFILSIGKFLQLLVVNDFFISFTQEMARTSNWFLAIHIILGIAMFIPTINLVRNTLRDTEGFMIMLILLMTWLYFNVGIVISTLLA